MKKALTLLSKWTARRRGQFEPFKISTRDEKPLAYVQNDREKYSPAQRIHCMWLHINQIVLLEIYHLEIPSHSNEATTVAMPRLYIYAGRRKNMNSIVPLYLDFQLHTTSSNP